MDLRVLGICAGNGVSLLPFRDELVANIEPRAIFRTPKDKQWVSNFPKVPLYDSIPHRDLIGDIDLTISHPDCGHSSMLRYSRAKKLVNAKDNKSLTLTIRGIKIVQPKIFWIENLPGLLKTYSRKDLNKIFPNYHIITGVRSAFDFGNSQKNRKRLIIIGVRDDLPKKLIRRLFEPQELHSPKKSGNLIADLRNINFPLGHVRESNDTVVCMEYNGTKLNLAQIREFWLGEFKDKKKWPVNNGRLKNLPGVYIDRFSDWPSTVRKQNRAFNFKGEVLSPRECARIQGIPDSFKIYLEEERLSYWLNKARVTVTKTPPFEMLISLKKNINRNKKLLKL